MGRCNNRFVAAVLSARCAATDPSQSQIKSCQGHANRTHLRYEVLIETGHLSQNPSLRGFAGMLRLRRRGAANAGHGAAQAGQGGTKAGCGGAKAGCGGAKAGRGGTKAGHGGTKAAQLPARLEGGSDCG
jgi:hypothetical protein